MQEDPVKQLGTLRVKAILENVPLAIDCVKRWAIAVGFDDRSVYELQLAVDEACANVVCHAYRDMEPGDMEVSCDLEDRVLTIRVRDWGKGFDPDEVPVPNLDAPLEERDVGGLGLFILKQVMDHVRFRCDPDEGNELAMDKRLLLAG
jgi:serine/threonine-protein kinase RsbW